MVTKKRIHELEKNLKALTAKVNRQDEVIYNISQTNKNQSTDLLSLIRDKNKLQRRIVSLETVVDNMAKELEENKATEEFEHLLNTMHERATVKEMEKVPEGIVIQPFQGHLGLAYSLFGQERGDGLMVYIDELKDVVFAKVISPEKSDRDYHLQETVFGKLKTGDLFCECFTTGSKAIHRYWIKTSDHTAKTIEDEIQIGSDMLDVPVKKVV